jgi:hypothetical protein
MRFPAFINVFFASKMFEHCLQIEACRRVTTKPIVIIE